MSTQQERSTQWCASPTLDALSEQCNDNSGRHYVIESSAKWQQRNKWHEWHVKQRETHEMATVAATMLKSAQTHKSQPILETLLERAASPETRLSQWSCRKSSSQPLRRSLVCLPLWNPGHPPPLALPPTSTQRFQCTCLSEQLLLSFPRCLSYLQRFLASVSYLLLFSFETLARLLSWFSQWGSFLLADPLAHLGGTLQRLAICS